MTMQLKRFVSIFNPLKKTINYFLLVLLLSVLFVHPSRAQDVAANSCTPEQVELFSCPLKSKAIIALCLNKEKLNTELVRINPQGVKTAAPISDLKQNIDQGVHGFATVLRGNTSQGIVTIFINSNPYDMLSPVLSTDIGGRRYTEFCYGSKYGSSKDAGYNLPVSKIIIKNESTFIRIAELLSFGIAKPLAAEYAPDWPNEDGTPPPTHKHHHAKQISSPESKEEKPN